MEHIAKKHLFEAIDIAKKLDFAAKELVVDQIFREQPNLLALITSLQHYGHTVEDIDVSLNMLIVLHLTTKQAGLRLQKISAETVERQLDVLCSTMQFSEGMDKKSKDSSILQYFDEESHKLLFAYAANIMENAGFLRRTDEKSKFLLSTGVALASCIANAKC